MPKTVHKKPLDYTRPLLMNGLRGRMLRVPASNPKKKNKELLLIYGHHASLERIFGIAEDLSQYGNVTVPDLPGFGGMDSFYRIGRKPSLDSFADYLAALIQLRYRKKRVTIVGMSFGFVVATRALQRYPELAKNVNLVVSMVGFAHKDDCIFSKRIQRGLKTLGIVGGSWLGGNILKYVALRGPIIRMVYERQLQSHPKLKNAPRDEQRKRIDYEVVLWKMNDIRTQLYTFRWMLNLDLCQHQVDLPAAHVGVKEDRYFNNTYVEQHINIIYKSCSVHQSPFEAHAPTVVASAEEAAPFVPKTLRKLLDAQ